MEKLYLNRREQVSYALRAIYETYGYTRYEMSKFEEYDLYARYGDSLISEGVITFTDLGGKLMALKPDVTLSIIKNGRNTQGVQKVYYDENVYRVPKGGDGFKEIAQIGLECMGDIDDFSVAEVLRLAGESLKAIGGEAVLDVCHLGIISDIMDESEVSKADRKEIARAIAEKNRHELYSACIKAKMADDDAQLLCNVASVYGKPESAIAALKNMLPEKYASGIIKLEMILDTLPAEIAALINIDFSAASDFGYYNGIVFKGYILGVPTAVLSGGQYGKLMKKMSREGGAVGFAVYPDMLDRLSCDPAFDHDAILLYTEKEELSDIAAAAEAIRLSGKTLMTAKEIPQKAKFKYIYKIENAEVRKLEENA